jgi:hypothetical protein
MTGPDTSPSAVIHVGFTKAASTSLQAFFRALPDAHAVDGDRAAVLLSAKNAFHYSEKDVLAFLAPELETARRLGKVLVVSHERLSGNPHAGHYDCKEMADRLCRLFPKARIVISIREQMKILASAYKQYVRIGGVRSLEDYLLPVWDCRLPLFDWRIYEYRQLVGYYQDVFGRENVLVPLVEELERDGESYFAALSAFMGVRGLPEHEGREVHNPGIPDEEIERWRFRNFFRVERNSIRDPHPLQGPRISKVVDWIAPLVPFNRYGPGNGVVDEVRRLFAGKFAESNAALSGMIGKDLAAFGYEVA